MVFEVLSKSKPFTTVIAFVFSMRFVGRQMPPQTVLVVVCTVAALIMALENRIPIIAVSAEKIGIEIEGHRIGD